MQLVTDIFSTPKQGNSLAEYEDAHAFRVYTEEVPAFYRFAVADGASESSFSNTWAILLAGGYCDEDFNLSYFDESVERLSKYWRKLVDTENLPWYAQQKLESGAFSSIAGLTLTEKDEQTMEAEWEAVGDSCIFQIRGNIIEKAFPLSHAENFNISPMLISSNLMRNEGIHANIERWSSQAKTGDTFLLMTDALACWLLRRYDESPACVIQRIRGLQDQEEFLSLIEQERMEPFEEGGYYLRNDDVTLIRITIN